MYLRKPRDDRLVIPFLFCPQVSLGFLCGQKRYEQNCQRAVRIFLVMNPEPLTMNPKPSVEPVPPFHLSVPINLHLVEDRHLSTIE